MNFFELLSLEEKYDVDLQILNKNYFANLAKYHPDMAKKAEDKNKFLSISTDLNKAYATLKDDLKRAEYLLEIKGININDSEVRNILSPLKLQALWNELEILESIADLQTLETLYTKKETDKKNLITSLSCAFNDNNLKEALDLAISFKYLTNLIDNIKLKIKYVSNRN